MPVADTEAELLITLRVPSRASRLKLLRALVSELAEGCGCGPACVQDIRLAVDEACQNVIRHAYEGREDGEIVLDVYRAGDALVFELLDFAAPVDKSRVRPRPLDELRPGGLGTHFIQECMDEAGFCDPPAGAGNRLRMVKRIA